MKKLYLSLLLTVCVVVAMANHITGGEMYYLLTGQNGNSFSYHVVLKLYRDCYSTGAQLDVSAPISIFDNTTNSAVWSQNVNRTKIVHLSLSSPSPCIQNPPSVCYDVGYYEFDVTLPGIPQGYTIGYQRCCRITGINNLINSSTVGATYSAQIPGTNAIATAPANNSAHFLGADTVAVCANNPFTYNFGASDADNDSLVYYFGTAYVGGTTNNPAPNPPASPPYSSVPYASPFGAGDPMGNTIRINTKNGLITGVAPVSGIYVVTVYVDEYRNGIKIATQKKDLQVKVADCSLTTPRLDPQYITCNGYDLTFSNHNPNPLIHAYEWSFGDGNTSTSPTPTNTYKDTGTYKVKLVVNKGEQCSDSAIAIARVYPGFYPGFVYSGICVNKPTLFTDTTKTKYGTVNAWSWNFGDPGTPGNNSTVQDPTHIYTATGTKKVQFIVSNSKGCVDTIQKDVVILDRPPINLAFRDTLICHGDFLQLQASGTGNFSWTPSTNISNANTATPTVNPSSTTSYYVRLDQNGCINSDTVQVRVVDFVTLKTMPDTVICATDTVQLGATTNGLKFSWSPAATIIDPTVLNALAIPTGTTSYQLTATIGGCSATDQVTIRTVPYPGSNAGPDTIICYHTSAQLHAAINGNSFTWTPSAGLSDPNSTDPIAAPAASTIYTLTVYDNLGCPKPGISSVVVTMLPKVNAFAGHDTSVVIGQPLQFNGTGGTGYFWQPSTGLNHNDIANPTGYYDGSFDSIQYKLLVMNESGCVDSAYITVRVFKTNPQIFVPTAFTPNGDGNNDVFRPIAVGITKIEYFSVFNRWGELVFSTTVNGKGWDGTVSGKQQGSGTFVWMVKGVDYTGKVVVEKGTVTLIRN